MNQVASYYVSRRKRLFDVALAVASIFLTLPIFIVVSLAVISSMGFPIFFRQKRIGFAQKAFTMYKFRTMYPNADSDKHKLRTLNEAPAPMFKIMADPRFMGVGQWLSRTGLDELPQLLNILRGEMSFVGPRPLPPEEAQKLNASWDFRYQARPGIFSAWSLSNRRHASLDYWKELEKKTLRIGGVPIDIRYILCTLLFHFGRLFNIKDLP